jgi:hypothetical protein
MKSTHDNLLKIVLLNALAFLTSISYAQQLTEDNKALTDIIDVYSKSVIEKDSAVFYNLFNDGVVTWCAALKDRSQAKEAAKQAAEKKRSNFFSGSYKGFLRGLFRYKTTEDKFDNVHIVHDGTVASVTMDYSFWADNKMTNWGGKYLTLIKRDGQWKITSVIYSLELTEYFEQPALEERQKSKIKQSSF